MAAADYAIRLDANNSLAYTCKLLPLKALGRMEAFQQTFQRVRELGAGEGEREEEEC